jgi:hypothetical protein
MKFQILFFQEATKDSIGKSISELVVSNNKLN